MSNHDEAIFKKWFGANNSSQPDINVKQRMKNTYEFMNRGFETSYDVMCCANTAGACEYCSGNTLAYVMGSTYSNGDKES